MKVRLYCRSYPSRVKRSLPSGLRPNKTTWREEEWEEKIGRFQSDNIRRCGELGRGNWTKRNEPAAFASYSGQWVTWRNNFAPRNVFSLTVIRSVKLHRIQLDRLIKSYCNEQLWKGGKKDSREAGFKGIYKQYYFTLLFWLELQRLFLGRDWQTSRHITNQSGRVIRAQIKLSPIPSTRGKKKRLKRMPPPSPRKIKIGHNIMLKNPHLYKVCYICRKGINKGC